VIHGDRVIVQCDVQGESFVAAYDIADGSELWRTVRDEVPTWSTPTVDVAERGQVIVNGWKHIGGYDLETGKELWRLQGGGDIPVPTPVLAHGLIFITNAHGRMAPIYAIDVSAEGDLGDGSDSRYVSWSKGRLGNYMQTPIVYGRHLYCCRDNGILACYEAMSGEEHYRERLGPGGQSGFTASAVAGDGKIYVTSEEGEIHVVKAGKAFEVLAVNEMGETCMATPAISEGTIFFRTRNHLVAVGE
jgi:outer membrane protein assembly factor BamB